MNVETGFKPVLTLFSGGTVIYTEDKYISRRDFIRHSILGVVGFGLGLYGSSGVKWAIGFDKETPVIGKSSVIAAINSSAVYI